MASEKVAISLGYINVAKSSIEAIREQSGTGKEDVGPLLASYATYYLNQMGQGCLLLTGQQVTQLETTTGKQFATGEDVIKACQHALKREDGLYTLNLAIDPAYIENLEEVAQWQGLKPEDVLQDVVNNVVENSWCYSWEVKGGVARFDKGDWERIKELTGKAIPTGRDILRLMTGRASVAA